VRGRPKAGGQRAMREPVRIASPQQAADARADLRVLEERFRTQEDPRIKRELARNIMRLRSALAAHTMRQHMRRVHDADA
jgi:hypothetical protein